VTVVTSADNPRFRALLKLAESARERRQTGLALIDGPHLVHSFHERFGPPQQLVTSRGAGGQPEVATLLAQLAAVDVLELGAGLFRRLSPVTTPTGILAVVRIPVPSVLPAMDRASLLLDRLQDPGNLGAVLRSAAAAGMGQVLLSPGTADAWSPKVLRAAMGAHCHLDIHEEVDLAAFAAGFAGTVHALDARGPVPIYDADLSGTVALLLGNEGGGLAPALLQLAARCLSIPMPGGTESLNVAAAAAICLYERVRQQAQRETGRAPA
jgi:RNA methyltransferase, TrmH family